MCPVQGERGEWVWMDREEGLGTGHREASRGPAHLCQGQLPWLPGQEGRGLLLPLGQQAEAVLKSPAWSCLPGGPLLQRPCTFLPKHRTTPVTLPAQSTLLQGARGTQWPSHTCFLPRRVQARDNRPKVASPGEPRPCRGHPALLLGRQGREVPITLVLPLASGFHAHRIQASFCPSKGHPAITLGLQQEAVGTWPGRPIKDRQERREGSPPLSRGYKTFETQLLKPKGYGPESVSGLFFFRANPCREAFSAPPASLATTSQKLGPTLAPREPESASSLLPLPAGEHCKHLPSLPGPAPPGQGQEAARRILTSAGSPRPPAAGRGAGGECATAPARRPDARRAPAPRRGPRCSRSGGALAGPRSRGSAAGAPPRALTRGPRPVT